MCGYDDYCNICLTNTMNIIHLKYVGILCCETITICHAYVTLAPASRSTKFILLSRPASPMCPSLSRAVSDPYMTVHIKYRQDLESLLTLREKGHDHQTYFLASSYHLLSPRFTSDPSLFRIEPPLFSTFHLPFTPTLLYHPNPPCVHPDSSNHRHVIKR